MWPSCARAASVSWKRTETSKWLCSNWANSINHDHTRVKRLTADRDLIGAGRRSAWLSYRKRTRQKLAFVSFIGLLSLSSDANAGVAGVCHGTGLVATGVSGGGGTGVFGGGGTGVFGGGGGGALVGLGVG